jgi:hypothetical protein
MTLYLHGISALEWWQKNPMPASDTFDISCFRIKNSAPSADDEFEIRHLMHMLTQPIQVSILTKGEFKNHDVVQMRIINSRLTRSKYINVGPNLFAAEPSLAYLQACAHLDLYGAVYFASHILGNFYFDEFAPMGLAYHKRFVTKAKLCNYVDRQNNIPGVVLARKAAALALENAASPKEIEAAMKLTLPFNLGGYMLTTPRLNYKIPLTVHGKTIAAKNYHVADFCWPKEKLVIEYDSDIAHLTSEQKTADEKKRRTLEASGYKVLTITKLQLGSIAEMDVICGEARKWLKLRNRVRCKNYIWHQRELFEWFEGGFARKF